MPNTYNNNFSLNPKDIALIEEGLRTLSEHHDTIMMLQDVAACDPELIDLKTKKLKQVNELLGKIYNQKIFYSQTHKHDDVPLG